MSGSGAIQLREVLSVSQLKRLLEPVDRRYQEIECLRQAGRLAFPKHTFEVGKLHVETVSSLTLATVLDVSEMKQLIDSVTAGPVGQSLRLQPTGVVMNQDQAWLRRQYAPRNAPPFHFPHHWHQDGALGFDFQSGDPRPDDLLEMLTCWIALTPCGVDAPGLELVNAPIDRLLPLRELDDRFIHGRYPAEDFWRPCLKAGDALVFPGGTLHRTHVTREMTRNRTSIELRFFPADKLPARLKADRFIPVPAPAAGG